MIKETRKDALCSFIELQSTQDCVDCERVTYRAGSVVPVGNETW